MDFFYLRFLKGGREVVVRYIYDGCGYPQEGHTLGQWRQRCIRSAEHDGIAFLSWATEEEYRCAST